MFIVGFEIYFWSLGLGFKCDEEGCFLDLGGDGEIIDGVGFEFVMLKEKMWDIEGENFVDLDDDGMGSYIEDDSDQVLEIFYLYLVYFKEDEMIEWLY